MAHKVETAEIGILLYPGVQLSATYGLTDLFNSANEIAREQGPAGAPVLRISHWRLDSNSQKVQRFYDTGSGPAGRLAAVIIPPSLADEELGERIRPLSAWIRAQHAGGATLCSICVGAMLLGETGLLAGRPATTHWALAETFAARFPDVKLDADKLIIDDADIITAGGLTAWIDLGLRLIDRLISPTVMLATARYFLVDPSGREQRFYSSFSPKLHHGDAAILKVQHWLQTQSTAKVTLADMAAKAKLGERTFLRRFQKATALNPTEYLQHLRVGKARELLEISVLPAEQIAWRVGYEDAGAFRKVFQKVMGLSPADYRRRFGVAKNSLASTRPK